MELHVALWFIHLFSQFIGISTHSASPHNNKRNDLNTEKEKCGIASPSCLWFDNACSSLGRASCMHCQTVQYDSAARSPALYEPREYSCMYRDAYS